MSNELPSLFVMGRKIPYTGELKTKETNFKQLAQTDVTGNVSFSQSTQGAEGYVKFMLKNEDHEERRFIRELANLPGTLRGGGAITGMVVYPNNPAQPLQITGGRLEDKPEIQEGNKGTTEYTIFANVSYSSNL